MSRCAAEFGRKIAITICHTMGLFDVRKRRKRHLDSMEACAAGLLTAVQKHREAVNAGAPEHALLMNIAVFAMVWNADLSVLLEELRVMASQRGPAAGWKRKLMARLLALTLVEAAEEFTSLLGGELRKAVKQLHAERTLPELNALHKELSAFRKLHDARLRKLRNTVVAHRDPNTVEQLEALRTLDAVDVERLGWELLGWTSKLYGYIVSVVEHAALARSRQAAI